RKGIRTLILTPTRELAIQIDENFKTYGKFLPLNHLAIFGGVPQGKQVTAIIKGVDILIATPGRLLDLINQGCINLSLLEILVLDEADRMLDMGFVNDVKKILTKIPSKRQTLFFSSTKDQEITKYAQTILNQHLEINVSHVSPKPENQLQSLYLVENSLKLNHQIEILDDSSIDRSLSFARTKHRADKLV